MPQLSEALCDKINEQIRNELQAAYRYLKMSTECSAQRLTGTAHWLRQQWTEELGHATKLIDYVLERGNRVDLRTIEDPEFRFESLSQTFAKVLEDEQLVTTSIHDLYDQCLREKDFAAQTFLQWFVTEQVEEERSARDVLDLLAVGGDKGAALLMIDKELGARVGG